MNEALTITLSIFGGGALLTFLQFLINRHDEKKGKSNAIFKAIEKVNNDLESIRAEMQEDRATVARIRILRFSDEILHKYRHSKESFDQVLSDIDTYENYCKTHPDYKNNKTVIATKNIKEVYKKCIDEHDFLT